MTLKNVISTLLLAFLFLNFQGVKAQQEGGIIDHIGGATMAPRLVDLGRLMSVHSQGNTAADRAIVVQSIADGGITADNLSGIIADALKDPSLKEHEAIILQMGGLSSLIGANVIAADDAYQRGDYNAIYQEGINITANATAILNLLLLIR